MMLVTTALLEFVSSRWINQSLGLAQVVLLVFLAAMSATLTFPVSVSGLQPGRVANIRAQVLIHERLADLLQQIPLLVCPAPVRLVSLGPAMKQPRKQQQPDLRQKQPRTLMQKTIRAVRALEAPIWSSALDAPGALRAQVLLVLQIGATLMSDAYCAHCAILLKLLPAESCARHTCDGGMHRPLQCDERSS